MDFEGLLELVENERLSVTADSRKVTAGGVFVAVKGGRVDGHDYVDKAIAAGAKYIVAQKQVKTASAELIEISDTAPSVGLLAQAGMGWPARKLCNLAVTGTNGKTTVGFLVKSIIETAGKKCGLIGTVENFICGKAVAADMTTPDAVEIAKLQKQMVDAGAEYMIIEASSHALDQQRLAGIEFKAGAFTNLTGDHLDYHLTMENYLAAKTKLFTGLGVDSYAILNGQSEFAEKIARYCEAKVMYYSVNSQGDIYADNIEYSHSGTKYDLHVEDQCEKVSSPLLGLHNISNHLAGAGLAFAAGFEISEIAQGLENATVPGRLERVDCGQNFAVLVDYAHTDDALDNVLRTLKAICKGRLIVVFGCGGDRDKTKRPRMARAAQEFGDIVIVTNDNPRTEDPDEIIKDIMAGFERPEKVIVDADRASAIGVAIEKAGDKDIILIAGKGHEEYQIIGTQTRHFSDREEAEKILKIKKKK